MTITIAAVLVGAVYSRPTMRPFRPVDSLVRSTAIGSVSPNSTCAAIQGSTESRNVDDSKDDDVDRADYGCEGLPSSPESNMSNHTNIAEDGRGKPKVKKIYFCNIHAFKDSPVQAPLSHWCLQADH